MTARHDRAVFSLLTDMRSMVMALVHVRRAGQVAHPATHGDALIDATNPAARQFVWDLCKQSFFADGIEMFWLDDAEPNLNQNGQRRTRGPSNHRRRYNHVHVFSRRCCPPFRAYRRAVFADGGAERSLQRGVG